MQQSWVKAKFCLGLLSSSVFLLLALQRVEWDLTAQALQRADWRLALVGMVAAVAAIVTFAIRWRVLLAKSVVVSTNDAFSYIAIGYLANIVFPLRLGEVARAVLLGKKRGISPSLIFGSVVLERTLDLLTVLMLALALSLVVELPPVVRGGMTVLAATGLVVLIVLVFLSRNATAPRLSRLCWRLAPDILVMRLQPLVARFGRGLCALRHGKDLSMALCLSVLAWAIAATAVTCHVSAFHLRVPWYAALFVLTVTNLGSAIPSSPGFIGVYHYLAVVALSLWVPDKSEALAYAIGSHGLSMLLNILLGCVCLAKEGVAFRSMGETASVAANPRPSMS